MFEWNFANTYLMAAITTCVFILVIYFQYGRRL